MSALRYFVVWLLTLSFSNASAFSPLFSRTNERAVAPIITQRNSGGIGSRNILLHNNHNLLFRGGDQEAQDSSSSPSSPSAEPLPIKTSTVIPGIAVMGSFLGKFGRLYTEQLDKFPIFTKSYTAGFIFGLSDYIAQTIENRSASNEKKSKIDVTRLISTTLVGFLYFGPAAHYWYEMIFALLPGSSLWSTLQKAFWGQVIFGPSFTCIFFATSLLQSGQFSLQAWGKKIKSDLPGAWVAGVGFWPLVDLVSYSMIPVKWIPLFINMCSLVWTVYLSIVANRSNRKADTK